MNEIKILVVEDDIEINRLVSEHLSREGYKVTSAFHGVTSDMPLVTLFLIIFLIK